MNELNKILQTARARKAAKAAQAAAHSSGGAEASFNLDNAYQVTCPLVAWELSDAFAYSEVGALADAERPYLRWRSEGNLASWVGATGAEQTEFAEHCLRRVGAGDAEAIHVLLYTMRGAECEVQGGAEGRMQMCRQATSVVAQCVCAGSGYRSIVAALQRKDQECAALSVLLLLLTLESERVRNVVSLVVVHGTSDTLLDVLFASLSSLDATSVKARKTTLLLWRIVLSTMGSPVDIDKRKERVRVANKLPAQPRQKARHADLEDMKRRVERLHDTATPPVALQEAMAILERNLHIPTCALREFSHGGSMQGSRTLSKVVGTQLVQSREHGTPHDLSSFVGHAVDAGKRRSTLKRNVLPFELWYRRALPHLHVYIMGLVKLLAVSVMECFDARDSKQPVVEQVDQRRHSAITGKACASTLLLLLRLARESHVVQHEHLLHVYADCDTFAVLQRFIKLDVSGLCLQPHWVPNDAVHFLFQEPQERPHINWNFLVLTVSVVQLLQKMTKHSILRVRELMKNKGHRDLQNMLRCHPTVRHYALKVLKSTLRLVKMKKRAAEAPIITAVFLELETDINDDWLTCWYLEQDESLLQADEMVREAEAREEVARFNLYHYGEAAQEDMDHDESDDEDEALKVNRLVEALLAATPAATSADFPRGVDVWLEEEVYCFPNPLLLT